MVEGSLIELAREEVACGEREEGRTVGAYKVRDRDLRKEDVADGEATARRCLL